MFDDFQTKGSQGNRKRMGGSVAAAIVLYGGLITFVVGTTTAAGTKVVEHLTQVEFALPPPPPPPPPPPEPAATEPLKNLRPKAKRKELKPPDNVPKEKPQESDAPLTAAEPSGPVDGFLNGVEGGTGTGVGKAAPPPPPPSKPQPMVPPVADKGNVQPAYPASAKRKEVEGDVQVAFDVLENGSTANAQVLSGPEEFHDSVLKTVARWRFSPAKRGGVTMRVRLKRTIKFQLTDA